MPKRTKVILPELGQTIIHFSDHGQDFLRWTLDHTGRVVACAPFQSSVWVGCVVVNHQNLRKGSIVHFVGKGVPELRCIKYRVEDVSHA